MNTSTKQLILLISITIQLVHSQTCNGILSTNSNVCNSKGLCVSSDKCSCYSGYYGQWCESTASLQTCTWNNMSRLTTNYYPVIDEPNSKFNNDALQMIVKSPIVKDRLETQVYYINKTNPDCTYPGQYWQQSMDNTTPCNNIYTSNLPWSKGKKCGWFKNETDALISYTGNIYIEQKESLGDMRGHTIYRNVKSVIPLLIRFQKQIEVSYEVSVFAPVQMFAAVVTQKYIPGPPHAGLLEFITQLQSPFVLEENSIQVITSPTPITTTATIATDSPTCQPGVACTQKWSVPITTNGACSFTGIYRYRMKIKCHPTITNPEDCPLPSQNSTYADVEINVNSEDFCTKVNIDIKLTGDLKSYEDAATSIPKDAFLQEQTAYFKATVNSPQATLKTSTIKRVQLIQGNITKVLYDQGINTGFGNNVNFALGTSGTNTATFNFKYSEQYTPVPVDSSLDYKITSLVEVAYAAIEGTNNLASMKEHKDMVTFDFLQTAPQPDGAIADKYETPVSLKSGSLSDKVNCFIMSFFIMAITLIF